MTHHSWHHAHLALQLLAIDPVHLGGAVIRMRAGPARDAVVAAYGATVPMRKVPLTIGDEQLFGGVDLAATLAAGRVVHGQGLFTETCGAILPMAERCPPDLAAKLAQLIDQALIKGILALDEGIEDEEAVPQSLADRVAFHLEPEGRMPPDWDITPPDPGGPKVSGKKAIEQLTELAAAFGIASMRAPLFALQAARAHALVYGRTYLTAVDVETAATLVYPHRATQLPEAEEEHRSDDAPAQENTTPDDATAEQAMLDTDMLIEAVQALLPAGVLERLGRSKAARTAKGSGAGRKRRSNRRGRPLPSRPGTLGGSARIDLIGTLRAAAPWQPMRRKAQPERTGLLIRPSDIRVRRYQQHSDRLLIFSVDASGSAAMARLGEAKGAIEILLADAYASRDHVALISFRGDKAETLLTPTRSLVQTKRQLSGLPGGGGTPLAAGLQSAMQMAAQSQSHGMTPTIIVLTDGRANVALDGSPGRGTAAQDATTIAHAIRAQGTDALVIDTGNRPAPSLRDLSGALDGAYIALPRADAARVSAAVDAAVRA
ncbi:MAG: magnesium chelatase subunit D [Pseudomonadota bacterium]